MDPDGGTHAFKLHLPGLLKVLAEHLYARKTVAVRELLQNAHDSCVRRSVEGAPAGYRPRIDLHADRARGRLTLVDNGSGLTRQEVVDYLATIGRSYTRELKEDLALFSPEQAARLVGQFGMGFLSAFLIADAVTVVTRSHREGAEAVRWSSAGGESYALETGSRPEPGTTVELVLKPAAAFLLEGPHLAETVRFYADFLPTPIHLGGDPVPLNLMRPPWEAPDPDDATRAYVARRFGVEEPLCLVPLRDGRVELGHDAVQVPLRGFLFVPPGSVMSVREWGDVAVFVRGMAITDQERDLLPPWARFVRGVVESPLLQPTASREGLHQDEAFATVRRAVEQQLGEALRQIARDDPVTWRRIVAGHADVVTGWAVDDDEFFGLVADLLPLRTSRGRLTLPAFLGLTGGTLYHVVQELGSLQDRLLAEGHDVPVIDAAYAFVLPFLEKYAHWHPDVRLVRMDGEAARLMRPVDEEPFAVLLAHYRARGVRVAVAAFRPAEVPAVVLHPRDTDLVMEARDAAARQELPPALAALVTAHVDRVAAREDAGGTLHLNASCPLVRALAEQPGGPRLAAVLDLLHLTARLFAGRGLTPGDARAAYAAFAAAVGELAR